MLLLLSFFQMKLGQQVLNFGQQNVDFCNLHKKLTLKVCSSHIGPDQDFFEFFVSSGKFAWFPNLISKIFPKKYFQIDFQNHFRISKLFGNMCLLTRSTNFFQVRSSHIWNHAIFRFLELVHLTLDQRVLKLNLHSKVQSVCVFHKENVGDHVVRARPSAEAIKSGEIWKNHGFWAKSRFLKAIYRLLGAHLCLCVHWNGQKWKVWWI